jgi:monoamine oxidase
MPATDFDVIVIGAGLAGIAATERLTAAGKRVALVEARSRFGGRVLTQRRASVDYPLEAGPEWFDSMGPIHDLLLARSHPTPEAAGRHWRRAGDELRDIDDWADGGEPVHQRLQQITGRDRSLGRALHQCCGGPQYAQATAMVRRYVEGFHAADPDQLSLAWWNQVEAVQSAEASQLRSRDGLDCAVNALLAQLGAACTVYLGTTVLGVRWKPGEVSVDCITGTTTGTLRAPVAVITLPLAVLRLPTGARGAVRFSPALSSKRQAFDRLATGPVIKLNLVFDAPFWRDLPSLRDALFVQDFSQPIPTWWTMRPVDAPVLVGWAAGPQVARVGSTAPDALIRTAVESLSHAMRVPVAAIARRLTSWHWHDWQRDPLTQGGYSWVRTGGIDAHRVLAAPLSHTLYFAGEATLGEGFNATMDGAIQSGWRAATELLARA